MKRYLIIIGEPENSLPHELIVRNITKTAKWVKISDTVFLISVAKDNFRIDEVCFSISNEGKFDIMVLEYDKNIVSSWNFKNKKKSEEICAFHNVDTNV